MAKQALFLTALLLTGLAGTASACVFYPQADYGEGCKIAFDEGYRNATAVLGILGENGGRCALAADDIAVLKDFVINGYSVESQDDERYRAFLQEAASANAARPVDCQDYLAVARNGRWTGYVRSGLGYNNGQCITYRCSGPVAQILWNDLEYALPGEGPSTTSAPPAWMAYLIVAVVMTGLFLYMLRLRKA